QQIKPVSAPGNISGHCSIFRNIDRNRIAITVADYVLHSNFSAWVQSRAHHSHRRFDAVFSRLNSSHVRQSRHHPYRAVPAHSQIADIVKEDDSRSTAGVGRRNQQRANEYVRSAWFVDHGRSKPVVLGGEPALAFAQIAATEIGS